MRIPLNVIHWYIGLPVLAYLWIRGLRSAKTSTNQIGTYFAAASFLMLLAHLFYVVPTTFLTDSSQLSWAIFVGDTFQYIALFVIWLIAIRIFSGSNVVARNIAKVILALYTGICVAASYWANIPYTTQVLWVDGHWKLDFAYPKYYAVLTGVDYLALVALGVYFFLQAKIAPTSAQKWRLRSFSWLFLIVGLLFSTQPVLPFEFQSASYTVLLSLGFLGVIVCSVMAAIANKKQ